MHMLQFALGLKLFLTRLENISSLKTKKKKMQVYKTFLKITLVTIKLRPRSRDGLTGGEPLPSFWGRQMCFWVFPGDD